MTSLTLSTVLAAAALVVAAAGVVASVPANEEPVTVSINALGGLELVPVSQTRVSPGAVASGADHLL